ncbi:hypothetical protein FGO68_gene10429 [Halteria grandinella]|uniref:Uncharacterized protein n=1 Tax=Halteria grandinella TaxID=5974 RepID=A0A8J8P0R1_HALGN|nr:hypothetical protein FGO68_gene10429 [Halteria grandinella]
MDALLKLFQGCGFCCSQPTTQTQENDPGRMIDFNTKNKPNQDDGQNVHIVLGEDGGGSFRKKLSSRRGGPMQSQKSIRNNDDKGQDIVKQVMKEESERQKSKRDLQLLNNDNPVNQVVSGQAVQSNQMMDSVHEKQKLLGMINQGGTKQTATSQNPNVRGSLGGNQVVAQNSSQENSKGLPLGAESAKIVVKTAGEETKAAQPQLANQGSFGENAAGSQNKNMLNPPEIQIQGKQGGLLKKGTMSPNLLSNPNDQQDQPGAVASVTKDAPSNNQNSYPIKAGSPPRVEVSNQLVNSGGQKQAPDTAASKQKHVWMMNEDNKMQNQVPVQSGGNFGTGNQYVQAQSNGQTVPNKVNNNQDATGGEPVKDTGSEKKPESLTDQQSAANGKLQLMEMKRRQGTTNNLIGGKEVQVNQIKNKLKNMALF